MNSVASIRKIDEIKPRLALISVDLQDGETAGYKILRHLRLKHPKTQAVALVKDCQHDHVLEALRNGAHGVVSREQPFRVLAKCLRSVHQGEIWATSDQIRLVFESLKTTVAPQPKHSANLDQLTPREKQVAAYVAEGMRNAEIALSLGVTENTVRNYVMKVYEKLGVSNRVQLSRCCSALIE